MKITTKFFLMASVAAMTGLSANAEATWRLDDKTWDQANRKSFFTPAQSSVANFIDLNNNGHLDVIYSGSADTYGGYWGVWPWNDRNNIYYNNGDGSWTPNIFWPEQTGTHLENVKDAEGNDVLDAEGNPVTEEKPSYSLLSKSGLPPFGEGQIQPIDFNNDGLVDLFIVGVMTNNENTGAKEAWGAVNCNSTADDHKDRAAFVALMKNNGDGTFTRVEDHGLPLFRSQDDKGDGADMYHNNVSVADYDHDGYPDMVICGRLLEDQPEGYTKDICALYRNVDGTGKFERMNIAKVQGGVWTSEIWDKDEEGNNVGEEPVVPKQQLEGWFLPIQHNVHFADLNNDGWVDIVSDGWTGGIWDGFNKGGSNIRVYLNREGKEFEDVTPLTPYLKTGFIPRGTSSVLADFDKDGYLDFFAAGYCDEGGFDARLFLNQLSVEDEVFGEFQGKEMFYEGDGNKNMDWIERFYCVARDFDGDGYMDLFFDGVQDSYIHYGDMMGTFHQAPQLPSRGYGARDGQTAVGDVTGNGLADQFQVGYMWSSGDFADWHWGSHIYLNETESDVVAPESPADVKAQFDEEGHLTVTWADVEEEGEYTCGYNVIVTTPSGKIISVVPADPETGAVKISTGKEVLLRPMVNTYTVATDETGTYKVGVQAVSLYNETYSAPTSITVEHSASGIESVATGTALEVKVDGDKVTVVAVDGCAVKVLNLLGQTVATGVANVPMNVSANGVFVVVAGDKSFKIVK